MSHIDRAQTVYTDLTDIGLAATRLGGQLVQDQKTHATYYSKGYCDHAIRFPNASYEVGVIRQPDGTFRLAWDSYPTGSLRATMGDAKEENQPFAQAYAVEAAKRAAREAGHFVSEVKRPDGYVEVELLVRA